MYRVPLLLSALVLFSAGCKDPEPITRCVIDRAEVLEIDEDYFEDTIDEGAPDLFVEWRNAATQSVLFTTGVVQEAQLPVNLVFVAANIEEADFGTAYEFTIFDADVATTQDFIALGLPFKASDHLDAERTEVDISDGASTLRLHLIWY